MKKRYIGIGVVCICSFLLTSCHQAENKDTEWDQQTVWKKEQIGEHITADFSLTESYENLMKMYECDRENANLSEEKLIEVKENFFSQDGSEYAITEVDNSGFPSMSLETQNGTFLSMDSDNITGWTKEGDLYNDFIGLGAGVADKLKGQGFSETELSFMSREDAEALVREKLGELLTDPVEIYDICLEACPVDYFEELFHVFSDSEKQFMKESTVSHKWSEADEIYIAKIIFSCDGIPVEETSYAGQSIGMTGSGAEIYIHSSGIISFSIHGLYPVKDEKEVEILSCGEILYQSVKTKYDNIIMQEDLVFTSANLQYEIISDPMDGKWYLTPVWKFSVQSDNNQMTSYVHVNAYTGEILE